MPETCPDCGRPIEWKWAFADIGYSQVPLPCPVCEAVRGKTDDELLAVIGRAAEELDRRARLER